MLKKVAAGVLAGMLLLGGTAFAGNGKSMKEQLADALAQVQALTEQVAAINAELGDLRKENATLKQQIRDSQRKVVIRITNNAKPLANLHVYLINDDGKRMFFNNTDENGEATFYVPIPFEHYSIEAKWYNTGINLPFQSRVYVTEDGGYQEISLWNVTPPAQ